MRPRATRACQRRIKQPTRDAQRLFVDATDWSIIPAENLVATKAAVAADLEIVMAARSAADTAALLGALEAGVDGVLLATDNANEARSLPHMT
jgi:3-dehydroquinate synthase class II